MSIDGRSVRGPAPFARRSRAVGNRLDAPRLHGFRFPADPQRARDELCG